MTWQGNLALLCRTICLLFHRRACAFPEPLLSSLLSFLACLSSVPSFCCFLTCLGLSFFERAFAHARRWAQLHTLAPGTILCREGTECEGVYVVLTGTVYATREASACFKGAQEKRTRAIVGHAWRLAGGAGKAQVCSSSQLWHLEILVSIDPMHLPPSDGSMKYPFGHM